MTRQTRFSILLYIIIALLLVVLWINPVQSWGEYTEKSSRRLLLGNAHPVWIEEDNTVDNEGFSLVLIFENFDITTEEITFAVYLSGPAWLSQEGEKGVVSRAKALER